MLLGTNCVGGIGVLLGSRVAVADFVASASAVVGDGVASVVVNSGDALIEVLVG